jgi:hypothetical protein
MGKLADYMANQDKLKGYANGGSVTNNTTSNTYNSTNSTTNNRTTSQSSSNNQPQAQAVQVVQPVINITNNTKSDVQVDNSRWLREQVLTIMIDDKAQGGQYHQSLQG